MMLRFTFLSIIFFSNPLFSIFVGNPSSPALYPEGLFLCERESVSFRCGYLYDQIYKGRYEEKIKSLTSLPSHTRLQTEAAIGTISINKRFDVYGIFGNSKLQLDDIIFSTNKFCWGGGVRFLIWQKKEMGFGTDVKYFRSNQRPHFLLLDKEPAPLVTKLELQYEEIQLAAAFSYQIERFIPYCGMTYLYSTIEPNSKIGLIRLSGLQDLFTFTIKTAESRKKWGIFLGISLVSNKCITINIESRFFDQNGWNAAGEIRF